MPTVPSNFADERRKQLSEMSFNSCQHYNNVSSVYCFVFDHGIELCSENPENSLVLLSTSSLVSWHAYIIVNWISSGSGFLVRQKRGSRNLQWTFYRQKMYQLIWNNNHTNKLTDNLSQRLGYDHKVIVVILKTADWYLKGQYEIGEEWIKASELTKPASINTTPSAWHPPPSLSLSLSTNHPHRD